MSKTEPIRGGEPIDDPSYRYQMNVMDVIKEKTKICITNLDQVARDLKLPCKDVLVTYIGKRVSAKLKVEKVSKSKSKSVSSLCDRVTILGNMNPITVRESIYPFIESFVLCPTCRLPELSYGSKKSDLKVDCAACGYRGSLTVDKIGESTSKKFVSVIGELTNNSKNTKKNKKNKKSKDDKNQKDDKIQKNDNNKGQELEKSSSNPLDIMIENESKEQSEINNFK